MKTCRFVVLCLCMLLAGMVSSVNAKVRLADPFIFYENGTYFAYGTYSPDGILVFTSKDLKKWSNKGLALNKKDTNIPRFFWAPEVYKIGKEYIMYFSGNEHLYVAKSKSPYGPFKQVGTQPMIAEKAIDSSLFFDRKKKPYITFVRMNDGNNIWVAPLNKDLCSFDSTKMKHCFSVSQEWERAQARVNEGPWVKRADNPFLQCPDTLVGVGHNSFFTDKNGKFRIVFHAHESHNKIHPRNMYIGTLEFSDPKDKEHLLLGKDIIEAEEE